MAEKNSQLAKMVGHCNTHDGENIILMEVSMGKCHLKFLVPCLQNRNCFLLKKHTGTFEKDLQIFYNSHMQIWDIQTEWMNIKSFLFTHFFSFIFITNVIICNPQSSSRKSALLSAAKKAKLKSNPSRVRFAESVDINGSPLNVSKQPYIIFFQQPVSITFLLF